MSTDRTQTWPARAGFSGFLIWLSIVGAIVAAGGFVWRVLN